MKNPKMRNPFKNLLLFLSAILFLVTFQGSAVAAALDFGWGQPVVVKKKALRKDGGSYLAWPIQIGNNTHQRIVPHLDIVAVTDTRKQYHSDPAERVWVRDLDKEVLTVSNLEKDIFPMATRKAVVVFDNVDPKASEIHFYVGGLVASASPEIEEMTYMKITYRRVHSGWEWKETGFIR